MNATDRTDYPDDLARHFYEQPETRRELAERYDVDRATVDRWIDRLDEHTATRRAQELRSHHRDLSKNASKAVAWSELGYSDRGIARRIGSTKSTVSTYLDRVAEAYGDRAAMAAAGPREGPLDKSSDDTKLTFAPAGDSDGGAGGDGQ